MYETCQLRLLITRFLILIVLINMVSGCSMENRLRKAARQEIFRTSAFKTAHAGISIYDPQAGKFLYDYQGDKYFIPASNTKIPTCYAAMKWLGDSLRGLDYLETDSMIFIRSTGDPTLLHRDFKEQRVFSFLKSVNKKLAFVFPKWEAEVYGSGWAWNDFTEAYMAERTDLPVYGNVIEYRLVNEENKLKLKGDINYYRHALNYYVDPLSANVRIRRRRHDNIFDVYNSRLNFEKVQLPFRTFENQRLLEDTLKKTWLNDVYPPSDITFNRIHSIPTDTILKIMMHRSDNFFAEQLLLMSANEMLGVMNEAKLIDTLLKSAFKDLPQRPRWVDGSGLSRYNLFTPRDMVVILDKMSKEFGMERIQEIFPTGGEGTITNYYKEITGNLFAKTGTLSGVVALSGYLYTQDKKLLLFSILVNNHQASSTDIRKTVEKFILRIWKLDR